MKLDPDICYQALLTRDARFDGCFFVGVATTGIYCRPVCPVKTPRRQSCSFFPSAAAAESAGFRPCLRCRPELAPGNSSIEAIVDGALRLEPGGDVEETLKALMNLPGIGVWTAQYVVMRALAWPDAFPHTDCGVMKAMNETSPAKVLAAAEKWRPWRAYAAMHLWTSLKGK